MSTADDRLRTVEMKQVKTDQRLDGHEETCSLRYKAIEQGQTETIQKLNGLHSDLKDHLVKTHARFEAIESVRWAMSGKLIGALVTLISFLLVVIGYLAVHGPPWA